MHEAASADGAPPLGYELLDAGEGRRLERFGGRIVDRPAPGATEPRRAPSRWRDADLRFDAERGWSPRIAVEPWLVSIGELTMELRATSSGGVGLYPEHVGNLAWLAARLRERAAATDAASASRPLTILSLFAHTGLVTLAAARAGAAVVHVDATRTSVEWARRNATLSGLADRPIRWLVDDAQAFVDREARRGRRYDGIVLDPPSFGRAERRHWRLRDDLPALLSACAAAAADDAFILLTAHTAGLDGETLGAMLDASFPTWRGRSDVSHLELRATSGAGLALGWAVRAPGDAVRERSGGTGHHRGR